MSDEKPTGYADRRQAVWNMLRELGAEADWWERQPDTYACTVRLADLLARFPLDVGAYLRGETDLNEVRRQYHFQWRHKMIALEKSARYLEARHRFEVSRTPDEYARFASFTSRHFEAGDPAVVPLPVPL